MKLFLSRKALARVVTSLLKSELKAATLGAEVDTGDLMAADEWPEELRMKGHGASALPCDSLDLLRLSAAVNEMFHLHEARQERDLLSAATFGDWLDSIEKAWASGVRRITFMTSGSTGQPRRCTHEFSHLETEITYLEKVFADRIRIVPLTPAHHIYGFLFTAMLPDRLGHDLHNLGGGIRPAALRELQDGDLVVTFPERWQWLYRTISRWPEGVAGVVSTARCPPELMSGLMERGLESLTEVYGSSETAGLALRRWPETHFRLMPHWRFRDSAGADRALLTHDSGLEVRPQDHLELHADHSFTLAGRIDAAVQVGGENVYPARIAALLRDQPGVADAMVRLSNPEAGGRLKAFVVPQPYVEPKELRRQLADWVNTNLDPTERPRSIMLGRTLPRDEMGKDCEWGHKDFEW